MKERHLEGHRRAQFDRRSGKERRLRERRLTPISTALLAVRKERREGERRSGKDRRKAVMPAGARRRSRTGPGATTTTTTKQEIINDLDAYIRDGGGGYSAWYVGIASDARDRLFSDHKVKEKGDLWILRRASFSAVAREIQDYFVNTLGTDGGAGRGVVLIDMVYAYKKASHTNP
ncbi:MAG: hypothetical protein ACYTA3_01200 [Planctomycetota bacterium]